MTLRLRKLIQMMTDLPILILSSFIERTLKRWISKQRSKHLGILLIFTPIPLTPKKCGLSIDYKGRIKEWLTLTYTISQWCYTHTKFCTFFPLYLTNYLIGLLLGPFQLGLSVWLGVGLKGTNKTLAPMGLGLFCQLLTSPKLPLTIFNTTI